MTHILHSVRRAVRGVAAAGIGAVLAAVYRQRRLRARQKPKLDPLSFVLPLERAESHNVHLEGGVNFRDVGGYLTTDGARVRRGLVFRSGTLDSLTEAGQHALMALDVRQIFDLRMEDEAARRPDRLPDGVRYSLFPITAGGPIRTLVDFMRHIDRTQELVIARYAATLDRDRAAFASVIGQIAEQQEGASLIHCTAGKDRTGMVVAVLLSALGVPDDIIAADYSQSNLAYPVYYRDLAAQLAPLRRIGILPEDMSALLVSDPAYIRALLGHLHSAYGSAQDYLKGAGVSDAALEHLRARLLERTPPGAAPPPA